MELDTSHPQFEDGALRLGGRLVRVVWPHGREGNEPIGMERRGVGYELIVASTLAGRSADTPYHCSIYAVSVEAVEGTRQRTLSRIGDHVADVAHLLDGFRLIGEEVCVHVNDHPGGWLLMSWGSKSVRSRPDVENSESESESCRVAGQSRISPAFEYIGRSGRSMNFHSDGGQGLPVHEGRVVRTLDMEFGGQVDRELLGSLLLHDGPVLCGNDG